MLTNMSPNLNIHLTSRYLIQCCNKTVVVLKDYSIEISKFEESQKYSDFNP